jgi:uncharacterized lipoprotein YehR (DUF1307 family)
MKHFISNLYNRLTSYTLKSYSNQIWFIFLSTKTVFNFIRTFFFALVNYFKTFYSTYVPSLFDEFKNNFYYSTDIKSKFSSNLAPIFYVTLEVCVLVGFVEILFAYVFMGSADVLVSNESLWLISLILAILIGNKYYQVKFEAEKSGLEIQIGAIRDLATQNAELAVEIFSLEAEILKEQAKLLELLENVYTNLSRISEEFDAQDATNLVFAQYQELVNKVFLEHLRYLSSVSAVREAYLNAIELRDINEELASEAFEQ